MMYSHDQLVQCWINTSDVLPNICCVCGMHTDQRRKLSQYVFVNEERPAASMGSCLVSIFLMMLGPLGWFAALFRRADQGETTQIVVKKKFPYTLSLCPICASEEPPKIIDFSAEFDRFSILAHPKFQSYLDESRQA